jgi:hypothetical protein
MSPEMLKNAVRVIEESKHLLKVVDMTGWDGRRQYCNIQDVRIREQEGLTYLDIDTYRKETPTLSYCLNAVWKFDHLSGNGTVLTFTSYDLHVPYPNGFVGKITLKLMGDLS